MEMTAERVELPTELNRQLALLSGVELSPVSLPPAVYVSEQVLAVERQTIFSSDWIGAGRSDQWEHVGDYAALNIGNTALLIVRNRDGELRAFSNVCTHRGTRLIDPGVGQATTIVCPFHQWTYDLNGALRGAPGMRETPGFDMASHCLKQFRVAEHAGFVFVCLADAHTTGDLQSWLKDFDILHEPWPLSDLISTRRRVFEVACNWKLFLDVFNEYYHLPAVHPSSINRSYATPDPLDKVTGQFSTQFGLTNATASLLLDDQQARGLPAMPGLTGRFREGTRYTWVFPNMTFAASTDCLWMYDVLPVTAELTSVAMTVCVPRQSLAEDDVSDALLSRYYRRFDLAIVLPNRVCRDSPPGTRVD